MILKRVIDFEPYLEAAGEVQEIHLGRVPFDHIPTDVFRFRNLKKLTMTAGLSRHYRRDLGIPEGPWENLQQLEVLTIGRSGISSLPDNLGKLAALRELHLSYNHIREIPHSIGGLQQLEKLYLNGNKIEHFPLVLLGLEKLRSLDLSFNFLNRLPDEIASLENLEELNLRDSPMADHLEHNLKVLTHLPNLKKLNISTISRETPTAWKTLPEIWGQFKSLEQINLNNNPILELPKALLSLSTIKRISIPEELYVELEERDQLTPPLSNWEDFD